VCGAAMAMLTTTGPPMRGQAQSGAVMREYSIGTRIDLEPTLAPAHFEQLTSAGQLQRLAKGSVIFHQGAPAESVFVLVSGEAKSILTNRNGDVSLLRLHLPGSIMGLTALAQERRRDAEAVAIEDATVVEIARDAFIATLAASPDLAVAILGGLVDRLSDFHHRVGDFLAQSVEQRLAIALVSLSRPDPYTPQTGCRRPVRLTHEDLANLLGARRPTISAALSRFEALGLIEKSGRTIDVLDARRLADLAEG